MTVRGRGAPCGYPDCDKPFRARGYCTGHYQQLMKGWTLGPLKKRSLSDARAAELSAGLKTCLRCAVQKPVAQFSINSERLDGLQSNCKTCNRDDRRLQRYGLTPDRFKSLLSSQHGKCAICKEVAAKWEIDHDHSCCTSNETCGSCVRGILCSGCNTGVGHYERIGHLFDDYLARSPCNSL